MAKFLPGQSGNPHGRPRKGETLTEQLRIMALRADILNTDGSKKTRAEALADMVWGKALEGDDKFAKMLYDRVDGMARQTVDLGGQDDNPLEVAIKFIDPANDNGGD